VNGDHRVSLKPVTLRKEINEGCDDQAAHNHDSEESDDERNGRLDGRCVRNTDITEERPDSPGRVGLERL
jgi:hypothetical protein